MLVAVGAGTALDIVILRRSMRSSLCRVLVFVPVHQRERRWRKASDEGERISEETDGEGAGHATKLTRA